MAQVADNLIQLEVHEELNTTNALDVRRCSFKLTSASEGILEEEWNTQAGHQQPYCVSVQSIHAESSTMTVRINHIHGEAEPLHIPNVTELWVGCSEEYLSDPSSDEECAGAMLVLVDVEHVVTVVGNGVFSFLLQHGERVLALDSNHVGFNFWMPCLHTTSRILCLTARKWYHASNVPDGLRWFIDAYGTLRTHQLVQDTLKAEQGEAPPPLINRISVITKDTNMQQVERVSASELKKRLVRLHDMNCHDIWFLEELDCDMSDMSDMSDISDIEDDDVQPSAEGNDDEGDDMFDEIDCDELMFS